RLVGEDLQGDRCGIGAIGHALFDDASWFRRQRFQWNRLNPRHNAPLSTGMTGPSSSLSGQSYCTVGTMPLNQSSVLLTDQVAVVTGGGAGIGRGIARGLAAFGAKVVIWERDAETASAAADEVQGLGIITDVRQAAEVDDALARTIAEVGQVSILVNNAGAT